MYNISIEYVNTNILIKRCENNNYQCEYVFSYH